MAYKQRWSEYFTRLDVNNNGFIAPDDAKLLAQKIIASNNIPADSPQIQVVETEINNYLTNFIKTFDADGDGKVSKEELLTTVDKLFIGPPPAIPAWWTEFVARLFTRFDTNKNTELSLEEVSKGVKRLNPSETDANIDAAYKWVTETGPSKGKYDVRAFEYVINTWATDPNPTPEAVTLTPFFHRVL